MKVIAMIPARYSASRFPGKLMKDLAGKPVITRTYEAARKTKLFDEIYIVTDSAIIFKAISQAGGKAIMSKEEHKCGSDRIAEVVKNIDTDIVINVQGDEPFIDKKSLSKLISVFKKDTKKEVDLASLKVRISNKKDIESPDVVKVISDINDFAIYFSRNANPYIRDKNCKINYFKHVGIYAFRKQSLIDFYNTPATPLEKAEKIEAIRYQEIGKKIKMVEMFTETIGIDTLEDLNRANQFINNGGRKFLK